VKRAKYAGLMRNIKAVEEFHLRHRQQTNDGNNATTNNKEKKQ
jgi:iron-sulfur cluster-binding protein